MWVLSLTHTRNALGHAAFTKLTTSFNKRLLAANAAYLGSLYFSHKYLPKRDLFTAYVATCGTLTTIRSIGALWKYWGRDAHKPVNIYPCAAALASSLAMVGVAKVYNSPFVHERTFNYLKHGEPSIINKYIAHLFDPGISWRLGAFGYEPVLNHLIGELTKEQTQRLNTYIHNKIDRDLLLNCALGVALGALLVYCTSKPIGALARVVPPTFPTPTAISNDNCAICTDPLNNGNRCVALPCTHQFHNDCIIPWLQRNNICPICRREVEDEEDAQAQ